MYICIIQRTYKQYQLFVSVCASRVDDAKKICKRIQGQYAMEKHCQGTHSLYSSQKMAGAASKVQNNWLTFGNSFKAGSYQKKKKNFAWTKSKYARCGRQNNDKETKRIYIGLQCNAPVCANAFTVILPGHLLCFLRHHAAKFLCQSIFILATIQSRAQNCRYHLSKNFPKSRLFRQSTWPNRGMGHVKRQRYECHFHGRDIV